MPNQSVPPPSADSKKAEKYISQFVNLINSDRLKVTHTDLSKFDPSALQDHFRIELDDYSIEVSHSKQPNSGADSYVMIFTNIKQVAQGSCEKVILAYLHLDSNQFIRFKAASEDQIERNKKAEEEKRFNQAIEPIDNLLEKFDQKASSVQNHHHNHTNHHESDHDNKPKPSKFEFPESLNKTYQS